MSDEIERLKAVIAERDAEIKRLQSSGRALVSLLREVRPLPIPAFAHLAVFRIIDWPTLEETHTVLNKLELELGIENRNFTRMREAGRRLYQLLPDPKVIPEEDSYHLEALGLNWPSRKQQEAPSAL